MVVVKFDVGGGSSEVLAGFATSKKAGQQTGKQSKHCIIQIVTINETIIRTFIFWSKLM